MADHDDTYWDKQITEAIKRAVGFYYEKTQHDIDLASEGLDEIKAQVDKLPGIASDVTKLKDTMTAMKHALTSTNKGVRALKRRTEDWNF